MKKTDKNKPLPTPPITVFGRKKTIEEDESRELPTADRMAAAMVEGKLDEFLKQEMPDNEYAQKLATMMLGMTGMIPGAGAPQGVPPVSEPLHPLSPEGAIPVQAIAAANVPTDVHSAIQGGDVQGLMDMLRREHQKRNPGASSEISETAATEAAKPQDIPAIDKETIDALICIAKENNVTLDWIILRAIKVYVREYGNSGRM
ncbi:MAG TPA: hypothetical protein VL122_12375 [Nitrospirota bacterium]|nr:hypothetical protein [Nitrospirota bacterium]